MSKPFITMHFTYLEYGVEQKVQRHIELGTPVEVVRDELKRDGYHDLKFSHFEWEKWAWPGGYPMYYVAADGEPICPDCCNANIGLTTDTDDEASDNWRIEAADINWEDQHMYCANCDKQIESAYGDSLSSDCDDSDDGQALASAGHGTDEDYGSAEDVL